MVEASLRTHLLHDLSHFGLRIAVGVMFIVHSIGKFDSGSSGFFSSIGLPSEMASLIGLLELIGGALLIVGVLTRISASLLALEMLIVMVWLKKARIIFWEERTRTRIACICDSVDCSSIGSWKIFTVSSSEENSKIYPVIISMSA